MARRAELESDAAARARRTARASGRVREVLAELAQSDGALSWAVATHNAAAHAVSAFGDEALDEFAASEIPRATAALAPTGTYRTDGDHAS